MEIGGGLSIMMPGGGGEVPPPEPERLYDMVILGGGPAAMSAAIYAARKGVSLALLARDIGGQVAWTSQVDNYIGFQSISGHDLTRKFEEHMRTFAEVALGIGEQVVEVVRLEGGGFGCRLESGTVIRGRTVVVATGKRDRLLGVPGEQEFHGRGVHYCATCDAPFYRGRKVIVAGGGNSAFEAAIDLLPLATDVTLVNLAEGWQADEILQRQVAGHPRARLLDRSRIVSIAGDRFVTSVEIENLRTGDSAWVETDGVFVEIGLVPNNESVRELLRLNALGEIAVDCACRTSVEGVFGAGDVTSVPEKQIVISAGEGAKAALSAYRYLTRQADGLRPWTAGET